MLAFEVCQLRFINVVIFVCTYITDNSYRKFMYARIVLMIPLTISKVSVKLLLERSFVLLKLFSFIDNNLDKTFTIFIACLYASCYPCFSFSLNVVFILIKIIFQEIEGIYQHEYL